MFYESRTNQRFKKLIVYIVDLAKKEIKFGDKKNAS